MLLCLHNIKDLLFFSTLRNISLSQSDHMYFVVADVKMAAEGRRSGSEGRGRGRDPKGPG